MGEEPGERSDSAGHAAGARPEYEPLTGLFWSLLWVFTPAAVVMAFRLPKGHPEKLKALFWSNFALLTAFLLLGVLIFQVFWLLRIFRIL